jgi:hypothetical protein
MEIGVCSCGVSSYWVWVCMGGAPAPCRQVALGPRTPLHKHSLPIIPQNRDISHKPAYKYQPSGEIFKTLWRPRELEASHLRKSAR